MHSCSIFWGDPFTLADGKKVPLESGKWQLHEYQRRNWQLRRESDSRHSCYRNTFTKTQVELPCLPWIKSGRMLYELEDLEVCEALTIQHGHTADQVYAVWNFHPPSTDVASMLSLWTRTLSTLFQPRRGTWALQRENQSKDRKSTRGIKFIRSLAGTGLNVSGPSPVYQMYIRYSDICICHLVLISHTKASHIPSISRLPGETKPCRSRWNLDLHRSWISGFRPAMARPLAPARSGIASWPSRPQDTPDQVSKSPLYMKTSFLDHYRWQHFLANV